MVSENVKFIPTEAATYKILWAFPKDSQNYSHLQAFIINDVCSFVLSGLLSDKTLVQMQDKVRPPAADLIGNK